MFKLTAMPIETILVKKDLTIETAGGFCSFEGIVRNHNEKRKVAALEYQAFDKLCESEAEKIFQEVREKFDIVDAKCFHRIGKLQVGETAVWVGVTAAHRDNAFRACRYIIDEIKHRLPIWKKEFYADGDSGWIGSPLVLTARKSP